MTTSETKRLALDDDAEQAPETAERLLALDHDQRARLEMLLARCRQIFRADHALVAVEGVLPRGAWIGDQPDGLEPPAPPSAPPPPMTLAFSDALDDQGRRWTVVDAPFGGHAGAPIGVLRLTFQKPPRFGANRRLRLCRNAEMVGDLLEAAWARRALVIERELAERSARAKDEFLSMMSHELRTPLNAILGFSEVIRDEFLGPLGNQLYLSYAGDIHRAGSYLLSLINDLLDLSKIEAGKYEIVMRPIDVAEVVNATLRVVDPLAQRREIGFEVRLEVGHLLGDDRAVQQILVNLLSNAIKFSDPGKPVRITSETTAANRVAIIVEDRGVGMTPDEVKVALQPFGQLRSAKVRTGQQGTGLGLPLVQRLTQLMGGTLVIESERNVGTRIAVVLPALMPVFMR